MDDIHEFVRQSFENKPLNVLNEIFFSLQDCMIENLKINWENNYKQKHMTSLTTTHSFTNLMNSETHIQKMLSYRN